MSIWIIIAIIMGSIYVGIIIGYIVAVLNIGAGRIDDFEEAIGEYNRGFNDGRIFQQIAEIKEVKYD